MTQEEIAKKLGVSKSTVSRALSGKGRIGRETRRKIKELVEKESGRRTVRPAAAEKRVPIIGVVLPADTYITSNTYFMECLLGICETAALMNCYTVVLKSTETDISELENAVEHHIVDVVILLRNLAQDKALKYLQAKNVPTGLIGTNAGGGDVIEVDIDNGEATEALTDILIDAGCERFALIVGELDYKVNRSRYNGFLKALAKNGLARDRQFIKAGTFTEELIPTMVSDIVFRKTDGIICGDGVLTTKLMTWMMGEGYRFPSDMLIASCLNDPMLGVMRPAVTAVEVFPRLEGKEVCVQLVNRLLGKEYMEKSRMDYEILLRKSTERGGLK